MKVLTSDQIISTVRAIRNGVIGRITYKTELPIKAEFKKDGYKITRIVEQSVRFGVNYHNIGSVIERKQNNPTPNRKVTNNYSWVIRNKIKHNNNTDKDYLVVATLPHGHNTRVKYILEGSLMGTLDMGSEIDSRYMNIVLDSYLKKRQESHEIKTILFENIISINKCGHKVNF